MSATAPSQTSPTTPTLANWLHAELSTSADGRYRRQVVREDPSTQSDGRAALASYVRDAHRDARRRLQRLGEISLDPLAPTSTSVPSAGLRAGGEGAGAATTGDSPDAKPPMPESSASSTGVVSGLGGRVDRAHGYPWLLHRTNLQGYLGEVLAGVVAEHLQPGGVSGWEVPAFRFRFHDAVFNELGRARQRGDAVRPAPGLLGDDCLAFRRDEDGNIVEVLVGEAKCTTDHRADLILEAHEAFDDSIPMPVSIWQLIEVLESNPTSSRLRWIEALQEFEERGAAGMLPKDSRLNLVNYVCGRSPARGKKGAGTGWLDATKPHKGYISKDRLEAVEIHFSDVKSLIDTVYRSPVGWDA